jgi:uncharacterized repeat protein (TIGR03803 family)
MSKLNWWKTASLVFLLCAATALALPAQSLTSLSSFNGLNGENPYGSLVQGLDGSLYGTAWAGGANSDAIICPSGCGTVFKITAAGDLTTLYDFCAQQPNCADGALLRSGLVEGTDGNLYGTTYEGGVSNVCSDDGCGTVFKISPNGTLTTLYRFCTQNPPYCTDGAYPSAGLVQGIDGNFYGTAGGGTNGSGTVFKITPMGTLTTLYSFCSQTNCTDGAIPFSGLVQATNGNFYGATWGGGASDACGYGCGTVFEITPTGTLTTLYSFCSAENCGDGDRPFDALIQATDGNLYGTTAYGGANGDGTFFQITPGGTLTTLHSFSSTDGSFPASGVVQATDGNFYGTAGTGGSNNDGTVFKITATGTLTTLYSFCIQTNCTDGDFPFAGLVQDTNGRLYGATFYGGASSACTSGCGTVFGLFVGLGRFVQTHPTGGKIGAGVKILGTNLKGASMVTFNGASATFTVESGSYIKTTVPAGATTGIVQVVTPSGTLSSNVPFQVAP